MFNILKLHIYNLLKAWPRLQMITSAILSDIILISFVEVVQFHWSFTNSCGFRKNS